MHNGTEKISEAIPALLPDQLIRRARASDRSLSAEIRVALREDLRTTLAEGLSTAGPSSAGSEET